MSGNYRCKYLIPKGIGSVIWYWNIDECQLNTNKLNTVLYFKYSPVNIVSKTSMDESKKDEEGTYVPTKINILFLLVILGSTI